MNKNTPKVQTIAVHGLNYKHGEYCDVIPPIHLSTSYERKNDGSLNEYSYTRSGNPNRTLVESKIAALEGAAIAIAFSSGLAAINAIFENVLAAGDHVIMPDDCYHGTRSLLTKFFEKRGISFDQTDMTELLNIENLITKSTKLIWIETPSNPQLKIVDIKAIANLAFNKNIITACDNTFATALLQKPLQMGIDFVMHATTKILGGHSDILGGIVCTNDQNEITNQIKEYQITAGAVPSPFDCWLLNRSLATFPLRFATQCSNAFAVALLLENHPSIEKVYYPGLTSHKNHILATQQMNNGFGSMVSILIKGGKKEAFLFASKLNIFKHATSLGGVESLVEHRRSVEGDYPISPDNLIRISLGIEHIDDLKEDILSAL